MSEVDAKEPVDTYIIRKQGNHWVATGDGDQAHEGETPDAALIASMGMEEIEIDPCFLHPPIIGRDGEGDDDWARGEVDVSIEELVTEKGKMQLGSLKFDNASGGSYSIDLDSDDMLKLGRWLIKQAYRHQPSEGDA